MNRWICLFAVAGIVFGSVAFVRAAEKKPGFLGIMPDESGKQKVQGAAVGHVIPTTAAAKAKLKANDAITAVNQIAVEDFSSLLNALGEFKAGDKIVLTVNRNGKTLALNAVLGVRPPAYPVSDKQKPPRVPGGTINTRSGGTFQVGGSMTSPGNLVINGGRIIVGRDYRQEWKDLLDFEITGDPNKSLFQVGGTIELAGNLYVHLSKGVKPKAGDRFEIVSGGSAISGKFGRLLLPELPNGLAWKIYYDDVKRGRDFDRDGKHDVTLLVEKRAAGKKRK